MADARFEALCDLLLKSNDSNFFSPGLTETKAVLITEDGLLSLTTLSLTKLLVDLGSSFTDFLSFDFCSAFTEFFS